MLNLYKEQESETVVDESNYIFSSHDALNGSYYVQKLYVRNDSNLHYYEGVRLHISIDDVAQGNVSPTGVTYQLCLSSIEPTLLEWDNTPHHNILTLEDIVDTVTYVPFYIRIYVPGNNSVGILEEATINIDYIEKLLP